MASTDLWEELRVHGVLEGFEPRLSQDGKFLHLSPGKARFHGQLVEGEWAFELAALAGWYVIGLAPHGVVIGRLPSAEIMPLYWVEVDEARIACIRDVRRFATVALWERRVQPTIHFAFLCHALTYLRDVRGVCSHETPSGDPYWQEHNVALPYQPGNMIAPNSCITCDVEVDPPYAGWLGVCLEWSACE